MSHIVSRIDGGYYRIYFIKKKQMCDLIVAELLRAEGVRVKPIPL